MLEKNIWIPIFLVLVGVVIGGVFWGQHITSQKPLTEIEPDIPPMPSLETYIDIYISDEVKEFLRTASPEASQVRVREIAIARHYRAYPDCREYELAFKDAERHAAWYVEYKAWKNKEKASHKEWWQIFTENDDFFDNFYLDMSAEERSQFINNMSDAQRDSITAKLKDWRKRDNAAFKKLQEIRQEEPIEPKPTHTHETHSYFHFLLN